MKLKNFFQAIGFRGAPKHYPYRVYDYDVGGGKTVHYAQWQHPSESLKEITAQLVSAYGVHIKDGDFCIDIGAHSGDTSLPMAVAAGKSGAVLALEPNPFVYHVLEKNARGNQHVGNILPLMAAAAPEEGFLWFEYSDSGFCNGGKHEGISLLGHGNAFKQEVFAVHLETELAAHYAHLLPKLSFVKVDAEGYDLYVLQAMEKTLRSYHPTVKSEVFKHTDAKYRAALLAFFENLGYTVYKIRSEPLEPGEKLTAANLAPGSHYDILAIAQ